MVDIGGFSNNSTAAIALAVFGGSVSSTSSAGPTISAQGGFKPYVQNEPRKIADFTKQSSYQQAVSYFKSHISKAKSVDDIVHDPKLLNVILTAFNLQDDAKYPAKVKAILTSDLHDRASYANSLIDPRYQQFAREFNVHDLGMANFSSSFTINDVISKYTTNSYELSLNDVNPALRTAAYFLRNVGSITDAYNILGDPVLRKVVTTALGLPPEIANLPVEDQRRLINSKIDITKLEMKGGASSAAGSATSTALTAAQSDAAAILNDRNIVGAAEAAVQTIDERITDLQQDYQNLAQIQDPNGGYAAEIPAQEAAAPVLVEQNALLIAAQRATGTVTSDLAQMQKLVQQVGSSTNTTPLADLKAQFQKLHDEVVSAVAGATYQFDDGSGGTTYTARNLIDGSLASPIAVQYDSKGDTVTVNPQNLGAGSSFQSQLDAANAAFQAVSGSFDTSNIQAASAAATSAQATGNTVSQFVNQDATAFSKAIAAVPQWAGTYDTPSLGRGAASLADAGSRTTQVNQLLTQIQTVAEQSAHLDPSADRSELQSQYGDLITKLGDLINTPGQSNVDNLLAANPNPATPGYYSYTLDTQGQYTVQVRTHDLAGSVLNPLAGADVSSLTDANAVLAMITGSVQTAMADAGQQLGVDSQIMALPASTLDPRAAVDSRYRQLASDMAHAVDNAGWNGANLLDPKQPSITLNAASANMAITIAPVSNYGTDVTQVLTSGSQALPSDASDTSGALAQLETARFNNARVLGALNQQLAQLDMASGVTNAKIKQLGATKSAASAATGTPINATPYAVQLVQKYLAQVDAQSSAAGAGGGGNSYVLQLLQPLKLGA